jgi:threonine dehydratase
LGTSLPRPKWRGEEGKTDFAGSHRGRSMTGVSALPDLRTVQETIRPYVLRTPLIWAPDLSSRVGVGVYLKLECLQRTGSFKLRGAASRMLALSAAERGRGVVTCSSGNHGRATAHMGQALGIPTHIYVPEWVDPVKADGMRAADADVVIGGATYDEAEAAAVARASAEGLAFVHPFDDPWTIAGQGTIGLEILDQHPEVEEVLVPLSGGGLIAGVSAAVREEGPGLKVIAASAANAAVMVASLAAGRPVDLPEETTLANALSGGIGLNNAHTFGRVRDGVDEHVTVTEFQIGEAMRYAATELGLVVEGGGAVGLAALLTGSYRATRPICVVLSGGNVDPRVLAELLSTWPG